MGSTMDDKPRSWQLVKYDTNMHLLREDVDNNISLIMVSKMDDD